MMQTSAPAVRTRYYFYGSQDEPWEDELAAWLATGGHQRPRLIKLEGSVYVIAGGKEARFSDVMINIVPALCLDAVVGLLTSSEVTFQLYLGRHHCLSTD